MSFNDKNYLEITFLQDFFGTRAKQMIVKLLWRAFPLPNMQTAALCPRRGRTGEDVRRTAQVSQIHLARMTAPSLLLFF